VVELHQQIAFMAGMMVAAGVESISHKPFFKAIRESGRTVFVFHLEDKYLEVGFDGH
jgi:hypothetical protein